MMSCEGDEEKNKRKVAMSVKRERIIKVMTCRRRTRMRLEIGKNIKK